MITYFRSQPVKKVWLFGSYAEGVATADSDVDLLIEYDYNEKIGMLKHAEIILALEGILEKDVDLVPVEALRETLRPYVDTNKIMIYEKSA
ncbi:MAG: nucleotidyltransferase domain-containing protein [Muribaculaceae bacterium]|nr:nucleotidyltransferase domain-containing protein [Muribaculaceae bacterium]